MNRKTKQAIQRYVYLVAAFLAGVAEWVNARGDMSALTWKEILAMALKGAPFVLLAWIAKRNLDKPPPAEVDSKDDSR
jgi:hypothetical protein